MRQTEREQLLKRLIEWRPRIGVLSVYVGVDPGDRSQGWRIELRDQLRAAADELSSHEERKAFEAASSEVLERFPANAAPPDGRGHVGFIEAGDRNGNAVWRDMQMAPARAEARWARRPQIRPLIELFAAGPHVGVVLVSADRVRLFEWSLGTLRECADWEITLFSLDWRERKAERTIPGKGTWTSASGRDQFGQRVEANRERFLHQIGSRVGEEQATQGWRDILVFGVETHPAELTDGAGGAGDHVHVVRHDLVGAPEAQIAARVATEVEQLNARAAATAVDEIEEAIGAQPGVALGPQETLQALVEGRARRLIFNSNRDYDGESIEPIPGYEDGADGLPVGERLVELAVSTRAEITPVREDEPAGRLDRHDGVAALLRY